jgi:hypothetical protein
LEVVQTSLSDYDVNCARNIALGLKHVHNLLQTIDGRDQLDAIFNIWQPWTDTDVDPLDVDTFMLGIIGNFMGAVQYSQDNAGAYANGNSIPDVCAIMVNSSNTPIQNLRYVAIYIDGGDYSTDNSYKSDIAAYRSTRYDSPYADSRSWLWQTCNEFGYYQSTDIGYNIFGSAVPVNYYIRTCMDIFGQSFNRTYIDNAVDRTLRKYGGTKNYKGTNVVLPNGSVDPWHALGLYNSTDPSVISILIQGTAHCADMYPSRSQDPSGLTQARQTIQSTIGTWL